MSGTMTTELLTKEILDKGELLNHGTPLQQKMQITILNRSQNNILFYKKQFY